MPQLKIGTMRNHRLSFRNLKPFAVPRRFRKGYSWFPKVSFSQTERRMGFSKMGV